MLSACFPSAGVEVSQGVGGLRQVLPEDQASVVQRPAAAAAGAAQQRVRTLPGDEGTSAATRALLHPSPGESCRRPRYLHLSGIPQMQPLLVCFFLRQQAHIPASIMTVLEANKKPEPKPLELVPDKETAVRNECRTLVTILDNTVTEKHLRPSKTLDMKSSANSYVTKTMRTESVEHLQPWFLSAQCCRY